MVGEPADVAISTVGTNNTYPFTESLSRVLTTSAASKQVTLECDTTHLRSIAPTAASVSSSSRPALIG